MIRAPASYAGRACTPRICGWRAAVPACYSRLCGTFAGRACGACSPCVPSVRSRCSRTQLQHASARVRVCSPWVGGIAPGASQRGTSRVPFLSARRVAASALFARSVHLCTRPRLGLAVGGPVSCACRVRVLAARVRRACAPCARAGVARTPLTLAVNASLRGWFA